jgi:hypothetical protein
MQSYLLTEEQTRKETSKEALAAAQKRAIEAERLKLLQHQHELELEEKKQQQRDLEAARVAAREASLKKSSTSRPVQAPRFTAIHCKIEAQSWSKQFLHDHSSIDNTILENENEE